MPSRQVLAWSLWIGYLAVIAATRFRFSPDDVYAIYREAALRWMASDAVYLPGGYDFVYLPQAAILWVPLTILPTSLAGLIWRALNTLVFAWGTYRLVETASPRHASRLFSLASVVAVLLAGSCIRHGQMTLIMGGMMMMGTAALAEQRWTRAAVCLVLAVALKPHALVLALLVGAVYAPMRLRLVLGFVVATLFPFALKSPSYVIEQYSLCWAKITGVTGIADMGRTDEHFAHLYTLLDAMGCALSPHSQLIVSGVAALLTLAAGAWAMRRLPANEAAVAIFTLAAWYVLVFNPRSERNTYALLAPAIGVLAGQWYLQGRRILASCGAAIVVLFLISHPLGKLAFGGPTPWMKPALAIVFMGLAIVGCVSSLPAASESSRSKPALDVS